MTRNLTDLHNELVHHRPALKPPTLFSTYNSLNPQHKYLISKLQQVMEILGYCHSKNKIFGSCFFMLTIAKAKKMGIEKSLLSETTRNKLSEFFLSPSICPALKFKFEEIYRMMFGANVQYQAVEVDYSFENPPKQENDFRLFTNGAQYESYWARLCFSGKMAFEYEQPLTFYASKEKACCLIDDIILDAFFDILAMIPIGSHSRESAFDNHIRFIETFSPFCFYQPSFLSYRLELVKVLESNSGQEIKYKNCCKLLISHVEKMIQHVRRNMPSSGCESVRFQYSDTLLCLEYYKKCVKKNEL